MTQDRSEEERLVANEMTVDSIMDNILYYRVHHYIEQMALVNLLPYILKKHPDLMAQNLLNIAEQFNLAILIFFGSLQLCVETLSQTVTTVGAPPRPKFDFSNVQHSQ
eukprot:gene5873-6792_t